VADRHALGAVDLHRLDLRVSVEHLGDPAVRMQVSVAAASAEPVGDLANPHLRILEATVEMRGLGLTTPQRLGDERAEVQPLHPLGTGVRGQPRAGDAP